DTTECPRTIQSVFGRHSWVLQFRHKQALVSRANARERNVLRICITENATEMRLVLQGRLTGPSVDELKTSWKAASQLLKGRTCKVDIDQLAFIDKRGNRVLRAMSREGAQFIANDLYMRSVAEGLKSGNGHRWSGMIAAFLRLSRR